MKILMFLGLILISIFSVSTLAAENIHCNLVSNCFGGGLWVQDTEDPTRNVRANCVNNQCQYEYKGNLWSQKKSWETMTVNPNTGESTLTTQVGGAPNDTTTNISEETEYMKNPPTTSEDNTTFLLLSIAIIVITIIFYLFFKKYKIVKKKR